MAGATLVSRSRNLGRVAHWCSPIFAAVSENLDSLLSEEKTIRRANLSAWPALDRIFKSVQDPSYEKRIPYEREEILGLFREALGSERYIDETDLLGEIEYFRSLTFEVPQLDEVCVALRPDYERLNNFFKKVNYIEAHNYDAFSDPIGDSDE